MLFIHVFIPLFTIDYNKPRFIGASLKRANVVKPANCFVRARYRFIEARFVVHDSMGMKEEHAV